MFDRISISAVLVLSFIFAATVASADPMSDAATIGANAGAMSYCKDHIASDDDKAKYTTLSIKTTKAFAALSGEEKTKALVLKKAAEDGDYLGKPLNEARCNSLRKTLFIR